MPNRSWEHLKTKRTFWQAHEDNQEAIIKLPTKQKWAQEKKTAKDETKQQKWSYFF